MNELRLHKQPYMGSNNRKKTLGRLKAAMKIIQSVPMWKRDRKGNKIKFLGFKYIAGQ